jgi:hypothetical protein
MSYFPNWKVSGAEGPYRVAPNFMVVVPTDTHVELTYGRTWVEWLSYALTAAGIAGLVLLARNPQVRFSRRQSSLGEAYELDEPADDAAWTWSDGDGRWYGADGNDDDERPVDERAVPADEGPARPGDRPRAGP